MDSGVKGSWSEDADGRCVTLKRPGSMPFSGEVSVCASAADGATMQLRAHSDLTATMRDFSRGSDLSDAPGAQQMQHGTVQVSAEVAAGETKALTITFGWRFPHLDVSTQAIILGSTKRRNGLDQSSAGMMFE